MTTQRIATSLQLIETVPAEVVAGAKFGPDGRFMWVESETTNPVFPFKAADTTLAGAEAEAVCFGRTMEELVASCNYRMAFEAVQNPEHWKGQVDAVVLAEHVDVVSKAIEAFTATKARVYPYGFGNTMVRVIAAGYWAGPAA